MLVVSQYFRPENAAAAHRMGAFADGLAARGHDVSVVCEQPNYPAGRFEPGYGRRPVYRSRTGELAIDRVWVRPSPERSRGGRLVWYGSFAAASGVAVALKARHDVVFATSPPLTAPAGAAVAALLRRTPFVLDVRDIWPEAVVAVGEITQPRVIDALERLERFLYRRAAAVTTTTASFAAHIDRIAGRPIATVLPNGALDALAETAWPPVPDGEGPFVVGFTGNLGLAQGLDALVGAAEALRDEDVLFRIVGDGPRAPELRERCAQLGLSSVRFEPPVPVSQVGSVIASCHALWVPLGAHPTLESFVPSKLYDAMAVGRPVIVAARGEAAEIARRTGAGIVVEPENGPALADGIRALAGDRARLATMAAAARTAGRLSVRSLQVERLEAVLVAAAARRRPR